MFSTQQKLPIKKKTELLCGSFNAHELIDLSVVNVEKYYSPKCLAISLITPWIFFGANDFIGKIYVNDHKNRQNLINIFDNFVIYDGFTLIRFNQISSSIIFTFIHNLLRLFRVSTGFDTRNTIILLLTLLHRFMLRLLRQQIFFLFVFWRRMYHRSLNTRVKERYMSIFTIFYFFSLKLHPVRRFVHHTKSVWVIPNTCDMSVYMPAHAYFLFQYCEFRLPFSRIVQSEILFNNLFNACIQNMLIFRIWIWISSIFGLNSVVFVDIRLFAMYDEVNLRIKIDLVII